MSPTAYTHHFVPDSSNVREVWYNENDEFLIISFGKKGGDVRKYRYDGVPRSIYDMLREANSVGKFINDNIIDVFPAERI